MIPKIIHYCWFGHGKLPALSIKCIESWRKYLPDYEIKRWDESNFDINIMPYVAEAYAARKYAFVSDVARFWILYNYGGIYFDTDVEVIADMSHIIERGPFMGCEMEFDPSKSARSLGVNPGVGMGASSGLPLYYEILNYYKTLCFDRAMPYDKLQTVVDITSEILCRQGMMNKAEIQQVSGIWIYPKVYFSPISHVTKQLIVGSETVSIHHSVGSWASPWSVFKTRIQKLLGPKVTSILQQIKHKLM